MFIFLSLKWCTSFSLFYSPALSILLGLLIYCFLSRDNHGNDTPVSLYFIHQHSMLMLFVITLLSLEIIVWEQILAHCGCDAVNKSKYMCNVFLL